jgi:hypothetical protein
LSTKEKIVEIIDEFNKYRAPEAKAKLVSQGENSFKIKFKGSFCGTCGFYDYFDDYRILLQEIGIETKIREIEEIDEGAIVIFEIIASLT